MLFILAIPDDAIKNLDEVNEDREDPEQRMSSKYARILNHGVLFTFFLFWLQNRINHNFFLLVRASDKALAHPGEYYEDEDESDDRRNQQNFKRATSDEGKKEAVDTAAKKAKLDGNGAE